jgi:hypothetical protein
LTLAVKTIGRSGGDLENRLSLNLAIVRLTIRMRASLPIVGK